MSKVPMPSPNGTNHAGLFLPSGSKVTAAYDAEMDDGEISYSALVSFLTNKLEPADLVKVKRMLGLEDDAFTDGASDAARRRSYAQDARALYAAGHITSHDLESRIFNGPPRQLTAAQTEAFYARFPDARRLKNL